MNRSRLLPALALSLAALAATPACAQVPPRPVAEFGEMAAQGTSFEFFRERNIFLPVVINGRPVQAALDSGAGMTTIDKAFADSIGLKATSHVTASGSGGPEEAGVASGVDIEAAGLHLKNVTVLILDLASIGVKMGHPLPLVLGRDAFALSSVDIDYPARRLVLRDPATFTPPPGAASVPLTRDDGHVRKLMVSIEGAAPVQADFDLGNAGALSISSDYARRQQFLNHRPSTDTLAGGVGGITLHDEAMVRSLRLGGFELTDVPALISRSAVEEPKIGANIGMAVFSRFHLITDYAHDRLILIPDPSAMQRPFEKDRSGLHAMPTPDRLKVLLVSAGSPAAAQGWKAGDEIVAVNGEAVSPAFLTSPRARWTSEPAGTTVELTLTDGSRRRLTLKDYF